MFGIQASLDGINQLLVTFTNYHDIFIKVTNLWPQELPGNQTQCNKTNVEIQILYLECQWKPHIGIILCNAGMLKYIDFCSKGCAHIASTKSTECPEPRNQGAQ